MSAAVGVAGIAALGRVITGPLGGLPLDLTLTRRLAARRTAGVDRATWALSTYSDTPVTIAAATLYSLLAWRGTGRWQDGLAPGGAVALETAVFVAGSALVGRPRPDVPQLDKAAFTSSFPSGHTAATTALHLSVVRMVRRHGRPGTRQIVPAVCAAIPPLVAFSRVYRGMHHPSDVAVGLVLGAWSARRVARLTES